ncbi:MAG: PAS domain S-box protein [Agriterribacter sp.]
MLNNLKLHSKLYKWSFVLVCVVMFISVSVIVGWILNLEFLKSSFLVRVAMNPVSAVLFILSGISFILLKNDQGIFQRAGYAIAALISLTALIKLIGLYPPLNIHIDYLLLGSRIRQQGPEEARSAMSIASAICFFLNGIILFLIPSRRPALFLAGQTGIILIMVLAWFSLMGYLYKAEAFYQLFSHVPMAIYSALCFLLLSAAHLFAYSDKGIMYLLTSQYTAGITARRLIPTAILIPTLLGFLRLEGHKHKIFSVEFGATLLVLSITLVFLIIIWHNATLLVNHEKENEKAAEMLRYNASLLQNISDAIFSTGLDSKIKSWNRHAETLYGFRSKEVIGKDLEKILRIEYPLETMQSVSAAIKAKGYWAGEQVHHTKAGGRLNVYISTSVLRDQEGNPTGTVSVARDITLRKKGEELLIESELRLQTILDTYDGPIYAKDGAGKYFVWNKACEKMTGYSMKQAFGKTADELFSPLVVEQTKKRDEELFATKKPLEYEWEWNDNGELKIFSFVLFPMYNIKGEIYGSCGMALDITSRKKLERNLREFNTELEKEVKQRTILLRELAAHLNTVRENERITIAREIHDELGQQMTVLKMDTAWLKRKLVNASPEVEEKINDLLDMINQTIATVRRIASELRPGVLDHLGLTAAIDWQLKELEKRLNIKTEFVSENVPTVLPEKVKTGVFRILQESLTNVARHANATTVEASLKFENKKLRLQVADNGDGFDIEKANRKTLGILGMKERAAAMNGVYIIESNPGKGTTVKVEVQVDG